MGVYGAGGCCSKEISRACRGRVQFLVGFPDSEDDDGGGPSDVVEVVPAALK